MDNTKHITLRQHAFARVVVKGCVSDINEELINGNLEDMRFNGYYDLKLHDQLSVLKNTPAVLPRASLSALPARKKVGKAVLPRASSSLYVMSCCLTSMRSQKRGFCGAVMQRTWKEPGQLTTPHSVSMQV